MGGMGSVPVHPLEKQLRKTLTLRSALLARVSKGEATGRAIHPSRRASRAPQDEELIVWIASLRSQ
ncbi:hypothetical protein AB7M17_003797 [Bradyrhizobium sp. USDA 377]